MSYLSIKVVKLKTNKLPGPLFEKHVNSTIQRPFKGSAMVVNEEVKEGLMEKLASDIYVKEKVWDVENALVVPFRTIMRWHKV